MIIIDIFKLFKICDVKPFSYRQRREEGGHAGSRRTVLPL